MIRDQSSFFSLAFLSQRMACALTPATSTPPQDDDHVLGEGWDANGLPRFVTCHEADYVIAEAEVMVEAGEHSQAALDAARAEAETRVMAFIQDELCADPGMGVHLSFFVSLSPGVATLDFVSVTRASPFHFSPNRVLQRPASAARCSNTSIDAALTTTRPCAGPGSWRRSLGRKVVCQWCAAFVSHKQI
jgi:hypothetical protein